MKKIDKSAAMEVVCNFIILSTNIAANKRYVLSEKADMISIPRLVINQTMIPNLNDNLFTHMKSLIFLSDLELTPKFITLDSKHITKTRDNQLNVIYASVVPHTNSVNNCYWVEFDYLVPTEYSNLLFEVIQNL